MFQRNITTQNSFNNNNTSGETTSQGIFKTQNTKQYIYKQTEAVVNLVLLSLIIWYWARVSNSGESMCGNSDNLRFVDEE